MNQMLLVRDDINRYLGSIRTHEQRLRFRDPDSIQRVLEANLVSLRQEPETDSYHGTARLDRFLSLLDDSGRKARVTQIVIYPDRLGLPERELLAEIAADANLSLLD